MNFNSLRLDISFHRSTGKARIDGMSITVWTTVAGGVVGGIGTLCGVGGREPNVYVY